MAQANREPADRSEDMDRFAGLRRRKRKARKPKPPAAVAVPQELNITVKVVIED